MWAATVRTEGWAGAWGDGGEGAGSPSWDCRSEVSWAQRKPVVGLDFLPCYHPRLKGDCSSSARPKPCSQWDGAVAPKGEIKE